MRCFLRLSKKCYHPPIIKITGSIPLPACPLFLTGCILAALSLKTAQAGLAIFTHSARQPDCRTILGNLGEQSFGGFEKYLMGQWREEFPTVRPEVFHESFRGARHYHFRKTETADFLKAGVDYMPAWVAMSDSMWSNGDYNQLHLSEAIVIEPGGRSALNKFAAAMKKRRGTKVIVIPDGKPAAYYSLEHGEKAMLIPWNDHKWSLLVHEAGHAMIDDLEKAGIDTGLRFYIGGTTGEELYTSARTVEFEKTDVDRNFHPTMYESHIHLFEQNLRMFANSEEPIEFAGFSSATGEANTYKFTGLFPDNGSKFLAYVTPKYSKYPAISGFALRLYSEGSHEYHGSIRLDDRHALIHEFGRDIFTRIYSTSDQPTRIDNQNKFMNMLFGPEMRQSLARQYGFAKRQSDLRAQLRAVENEFIRASQVAGASIESTELLQQRGLLVRKISKDARSFMQPALLQSVKMRAVKQGD